MRAIIHKWRKNGTVVNLPRSGRPTKITPRAQRRLIQEVTKDPTTTSKELQALLASVKVSVHDSTIKNMAAPCLAAATLAPDSIGYLIGNKPLRHVSSAVYVQHSRAKLIYDRHFMLELRKVKSSGIVDTITLDTLHSLGLLCLPDPAAYEAAVCPTDTGRSRRRRRRCDRKRKRGSRGGLTAKLKANPCRTPLPSILLANVRSVENKLDYLKLDLTTKQEM